MDAKKKLSRRIKIQWSLVPIVFLVIGFGYHYPILGYIVPIVMLTAIFMSFYKGGRFFCGNFCPRGSFFDRIMSKLSFKRKIPAFFKSRFLRISVLLFMFLFLTFQMFNKPESLVLWEHIGRVFWFMCIATSVLGVALAVFISPRTWCSFCPMGTIQNWIGTNKSKPKLRLDIDKCVGCKRCEKVCPMNLSIVKQKGGDVSDPDCLKCGECVAACPKSALKL